MNATTYTPDRRPLAARSWGASRSMAAWLAARGIAPNTISLSGVVASLGAGAALAASGVSGHASALLVAACVLILLRGMCNMLDGMVAMATGRASRVGELFNEVPDRISDAATLVGAGYAAGSVPVLGFVAAIAALFTAYVRVQGCALGTKADFRGPMAKTHRMFVVVAASLFMAFAPASWQPPPGVMPVALSVIVAGCVVTAWRRLRRTARLLEDARP